MSPTVLISQKDFANVVITLSNQSRNLIELDPSGAEKGIYSHQTTGTDDKLVKIQTITDEYNYWISESVDNKGKMKQRAQFFADGLKPIKSDFERINNTNLADYLEIVDKMHDCLDEIWRQDIHNSYSQQRMTSLLTILIDQLLASLQNKLSHNIISNDISESIQKIRIAMEICENIAISINTLSFELWPHSQTNKWMGPPFQSKLLNRFNERLKLILDLRMGNKLLQELLHGDEVGTNALSKAFENCDPLNCSIDGESEWEVIILN
jgi:hypothetical protein